MATSSGKRTHRTQQRPVKAPVSRTKQRTWNSKNSPDESLARHRMVERVLATIQRFDASTGEWTPRKALASASQRCRATTDHYGSDATRVIKIPLKRGGMLQIFPNLLAPRDAEGVKGELLSKKNTHLFRQYKIQGINNEPRAHFLLHEDATDDFQHQQPGYKYGHTTTKARPLSVLPKVEAVSQSLAKKCGVKKWTIGVNPVLYRGRNDKMGQHADDDQGEQLILAVIFDAPKSQVRPIRIQPFLKKLKTEVFQDGDEDIEIFLRPGDGYSMDETMQESYSHGVAPMKTLKKEELSAGDGCSVGVGTSAIGAFSRAAPRQTANDPECWISGSAESHACEIPVPEIQMDHGGANKQSNFPEEAAGLQSHPSESSSFHSTAAHSLLEGGRYFTRAGLAAVNAAFDSMSRAERTARNSFPSKGFDQLDGKPSAVSPASVTNALDWPVRQCDPQTEPGSIETSPKFVSSATPSNLTGNDTPIHDTDASSGVTSNVKSRKPTDANDEAKRLVIVFRTGRQVEVVKDSGTMCTTLEPRKQREYQFGQIPGLDEGNLYSREEMTNLGGHRGQQRGISGNAQVGCDALIVSGLREDKKGHDKMHNLRYAVEKRKGALAVVGSSKCGTPIRVFRSSSYDHPYRATCKTKLKSASMYRYDGLYFVQPSFRTPEFEGGPFEFELIRASSCAVGSRYKNAFGTNVYLAHCQDLGTVNSNLATW